MSILLRSLCGRSFCRLAKKKRLDSPRHRRLTLVAPSNSIKNNDLANLVSCSYHKLFQATKPPSLACLTSRRHKMGRKSASAQQNAAIVPNTTLAPARPAVYTQLPVTESERALFAACFGKLIDQILGEPD